MQKEKTNDKSVLKRKRQRGKGKKRERKQRKREVWMRARTKM